jgi:hypothetical protein
VKALATHTNTTSRIDCTNISNSGHLHVHVHVVACLQLANQLDSIEDVQIVVTELVDSVLGFLPSSMPLERWGSKLTRILAN